MSVFKNAFKNLLGGARQKGKREILKDAPMARRIVKDDPAAFTYSKGRKPGSRFRGNPRYKGERSLADLQSQSQKLDWLRSGGQKPKSAGTILEQRRMDQMIRNSDRKTGVDLQYYTPKEGQAAMVDSYSKTRNMPSSTLEGQQGFVSEAFGFADDPYKMGYKGGRKTNLSDAEYLAAKADKTLTKTKADKNYSLSKNMTTKKATPDEISPVILDDIDF